MYTTPVGNIDEAHMKKSTIVGTGVGFERTARVTGYLTRVTRMNHGKQCEYYDRVKHDIVPNTCECRK